MKRIIIAAVSLVSLAACGGSSAYGDCTAATHDEPTIVQAGTQPQSGNVITYWQSGGITRKCVQPYTIDNMGQRSASGDESCAEAQGDTLVPVTSACDVCSTTTCIPAAQ